MSNPERTVRHQLRRSAEDISDEWKRLPEPVRQWATVQAVVGGTLLTAGALPGAAGAGAGGAGAGAASGVGSLGAAASSTTAISGGGAAAAGGGGFLGGLGSAASSIGGALNSANPALLQIGGQAVASAFTPEPERQTDILREQEAIRQARTPAPVAGGGGFLGPQSAPQGFAPQSAPGAPQPGDFSPPPVSAPGGYWDPNQNRWVQG